MIESKLESKFLKSVDKMSYNDGLIKFISNQIPDSPCNKEEVSNFLDRAYPLELLGNILIYKDDNSDEY